MVTYRNEEFSSSCTGSYSFKRIWKVVDNCGNVSLSDSIQVIEVLDTMRPTYTRPADTVLYVDNNCDVVTTPTVTGTPTNRWDNCTAATDLSVTSRDEVVYGCGGTKTITRYWRVVDDCGNVSVSDSVQTIEVRDTTRPIYVRPVDTILYKNDLCVADTTTTAIGVPTSLWDNCTAEANLTVTYRNANFASSCEGAYTFERIWRVVDECGNVSVKDSIQVIEVRDTMKPTFTVPKDTTICRVAGEIVAPISVTGDVTDEADNCTTVLDATWVDLDTLPADNSGNRIIRREWTLVDDCGNPTTKIQYITIRPSVLTPGNITFSCPDTTVTLKYGVCDTLIELHRTLINNMSDMTVVLDSAGIPADHRYRADIDQPYVITWRITDDCGDYVEFQQRVTVLFPPCGPGVTATDGDGIVYPTVQVGCNCWTAQNARSTQYADHTPITPAPMQYPGTENHPEDTIYGKLYTYNAATRIPLMRSVPTQVQGICPDGWHIPDDEDFTDLMVHWEGDDVNSTEHWLTPGTNLSGFTMEPGGRYNSELDRYEYLYVKGYLWSYTPGATSIAHACEFGSTCGTIEIIPATVTTGFSVRCVHDAE